MSIRGVGRFLQLVLFKPSAHRPASSLLKTTLKIKGHKKGSKLARSNEVPRASQMPPAPCAQILRQIWHKLHLSYFPERTDLLSYLVVWSNRRQKRTLASCDSRRKKVNVARELSYPQYETWLEPLLYHEMCHAVLERNVSRSAKGRLWHGPEFKALERRHPRSAELRDWVRAGGFRQAVRSDRAKRARQYTPKAR